MRAKILIAVLAASVLAPVGAGANGSESLGRSHQELLIGGGVVAEGVGLAGRLMDPPRRGQPGTIRISSIPAGARVVRAFLYWVVLGGPDWIVTFQGQQMQGTEIGVSVDSWSCGFENYVRNIAYRLDVTHLVQGNGSYSVAGVGNEGPRDDAQGASLVVLYEDDTKATVTEVTILDGAITGGNLGDGIPTGGFEDNFAQFGGLAANAGALSARLHVGFGDGQGTPGELNPGAGPLKIAGHTLADRGFLSSTDGPLWDAQSFDVPPALFPAGTSSATVEINSGDDCIVWNYAVLERTLPDIFGPIIRGVPDRPANAAGWHDGPVTIRWEVRDPSGAAPLPDTLASTEGRNVTYTSGQSCDTLGNCSTGSIALSIDATPPETTLRPMEIFFIDFVEQDEVRMFDDWVSGTATDALSGVATVKVHAENLTADRSYDVPLENFWCENNSTARCNYDARLPDERGLFRVTVTAVDAAGVEDPEPIVVTYVRPPDPFGGECPLGPLCD